MTPQADLITVGVFRLRWERIPPPAEAGRLARWRRWYRMVIAVTPWPDVRGSFVTCGRTPQVAAGRLAKAMDALAALRMDQGVQLMLTLRLKLEDEDFGRLVRGEVVDLDGGAVQVALSDIGHVRMVEQVMEALSPETRVAVVDALAARWCRGCGREQPPHRYCQCENDD